jgi:hypothetical protein
VKRKTFPKLTWSELEEKVKKIYSDQLSDDIVPRPGWGKSPMYYISKDYSIDKLIPVINCKSILDYGCGLSTVVDTLKQEFKDINYAKYDPFVSEYSGPPVKNYDLVLCNLVLQLLNPTLLDDAIKDLYQLSNEYVFVSVNLHEECDVDQKIIYWKNNLSMFKIISQELSDVETSAQAYNHTKILSFLLKKLN